MPDAAWSMHALGVARPRRGALRTRGCRRPCLRRHSRWAPAVRQPAVRPARPEQARGEDRRPGAVQAEEGVLRVGQHARHAALVRADARAFFLRCVCPPARCVQACGLPGACTLATAADARPPSGRQDGAGAVPLGAGGRVGRAPEGGGRGPRHRKGGRLLICRVPVGDLDARRAALPEPEPAGDRRRRHDGLAAAEHAARLRPRVGLPHAGVRA